MSDIPPNIARFNLITLVVLNKLYEVFPRGLDLEPYEAGIASMPDLDSISPEGVFDVFEVTRDTIEWLQGEGFLTFQNPNNEQTFFNTKLTMKGLVALGYVPAALQPGEPREPLIDKIKAILAGGAKAATKEIAKTIVIRLFTLALSMHGGSASAGAAMMDV